jgi:hypothetical protein
MAETYAGETGIIMKIQSRTGVPVEGISEIPFDREVLFPPGTSLRLLSTSTDAEGRLVLNFEEVE